MSLLFVSYYTTNYKVVAETYLLPSLQLLNLNYITTEIEDKKGWKLNTDFKPTIIKKYLDLVSNDLDYIDVDAKVNSYPQLLFDIPISYDLAVHYLDWDSHYGKGRGRGKIQLASGTLLLRNNNKIRSLVEEWEQIVPNFKEEQLALEKLLEKRTDIKVYRLPREYLYINSTPWGKPVILIGNPVITHFQNSREAKLNDH